MVKSTGSAMLMLGAIGVVFGDIGTSPLYVLQAIFAVSGIAPTPFNIAGIISLVIWSIILVVSIKYIGLVTRAHNRGEGGAMALLGLIRQSGLRERPKLWFTILGFAGISLFYCDGIVTPAISVLSAVEGVKLFAPQLTPYIIAITIVFLAALFAIQSRGTATIGKVFGPIMVTWLVVSALGGLYQVMQYTPILLAFLPTTALHFITAYPVFAFLGMASVILAVTGAEALYADMGHFGRKPIVRAWMWLVFPALTLNYLGQAALIIQHPGAISSSYFLLFPQELYIPVVIIATLATLIASQAVISGAFSLTRQAIHMGFLPRMNILHTSRDAAGQIYIPVINWLLATLVILLVTLFGSSSSLALIYGMAVSITLLVDSLLFLAVVRIVWKRAFFVMLGIALLFLPLDITFVLSNSIKLLHGAWVPLVVGLISFILLTTWFKGHSIISRQRHRMEGSLEQFVYNLHRREHLARVPGHAIYLGHSAGNAPLALRDTVNQLHELHEHVTVVTVKTANIPHIPEDSRITFDELGHPDDGISHVTLHFGYKDTPNVPRALEDARSLSPEIDFNPYTANYFISHVKPTIGHNRRMSYWRKKLYLLLDRNAATSTDYFKLPLNRTVEMSSYVEL